MAAGVVTDRAAEVTDPLARPGSRPDRGAGRLRDALRTTPALILVSGAVLLVALLATAVVAVRSEASATTVGQRSAGLAVATSTSARQIYAGLADADVAASAVFLLSFGEPDQAKLITDYERAVQRVEGALSESMAYAVGDPDRSARLVAIAARLRVYRQIVRDALAAAEVTRDVGSEGVLASAYAREASHYMAEQLLTTARVLWDYDTGRLKEARTDARLWAATVVLVPLAALVALVVVQRWLWRRTRRRLNAGLLLASLCTVAVLGLLVSSWSHWLKADGKLPALERGITQQTTLQQELVKLLNGRADIYLGLGATVDPEGHRRDFDDRDLCAGGDYDIVNCKDTLAGVWTARNQPNAFQTAIDKVLPGGEASKAFDDAEQRVTDGLSGGDATVQAAVRKLPEAPRHLGGPAAWLTLLAGAGVVAGLRQRLVEYR